MYNSKPNNKKDSNIESSIIRESTPELSEGGSTSDTDSLKTMLDDEDLDHTW